MLFNVGTFTPNPNGGRVNEIRANPADIGQAVAPLGANGFNIPSLLSVHETAPYLYTGLAQTLAQVFDGSQDANGGTRHHFVTDPTMRGELVAYLRSIDSTAFAFTDDPLIVGVTVIKAVHVLELRDRIDAVRVRVGLSPNVWSEPLDVGITPIRAQHILGLRTALSEAYTAAGIAQPIYTDPTLTVGTTTVKAVHIAELRTAVLAIE